MQAKRGSTFGEDGMEHFNIQSESFSEDDDEKVPDINETFQEALTRLGGFGRFHWFATFFFCSSIGSSGFLNGCVAFYELWP